MNGNRVTNEISLGGGGGGGDRNATSLSSIPSAMNNNVHYAGSRTLPMQQYYEQNQPHHQVKNNSFREQSRRRGGVDSLTSTMGSTAAPEDIKRNGIYPGKGHYSSSSSMELYFSWFSAIVFVGELVIDVSLAAFYFQSGHAQWALITVAIILLPLVLCQVYSVVLMRSDQHSSSSSSGKRQSVWSPILWHISLMGIPYRYLALFKRVDHLPSHEVRYKLQEIQAIQTINAILQYCPQCLFQVFIIMHRNFACLFTGISAGLAGFSFAWHLFLQCYTLAQRNHEDYKITAGPNFTSNLRVNNLENNSSSLATILTTTSSTSIAVDDRNSAVNYNPSMGMGRAEEAAALKKNLKILEKNSLMDNRNLVPKEGKSVEKVKIFQFNKRRPIYQGDEIDFIDSIDQMDESDAMQNKSTVYYEMDEEEEDDDLQKPSSALSGFGGAGAAAGADVAGSMPRLKRKGICSSQEMLHLVDLMNENISADQIDTLEKSLLDLNGLETGDTTSQPERKGSGSVITDQKSVLGSRSSEGGDGESTNIFKGFPDSLDESIQSSILENIDAAIYENQIIFQERIRKNQLTIQNLKLQDQLLSQFMDLNVEGVRDTNGLQMILMSLEEQRRRASLVLAAAREADDAEDDVGMGLAAAGADPNNSMGYLSTRDYENMCFVNITRNVNKLKHWRNYVQNMQGSQHDSSSAMHSSFFGNTTTTTSNSMGLTELAEAKVDDLYMVMQPIVQNKNILVETINQINDQSPLKPEHRSNAIAAGTVEFDCGLVGDEDAMGGHRKNGKSVPGLYFYTLNGGNPLDSILESNCEDI